ncbi:hypothetical protein TSMEX_006108 [Taenia solium]|eukprot:TsM_000532700 transcript=TsM_000532700 gene=TsM_000532700
MVNNQFGMLGLLKLTEIDPSFGVFAPGIDLSRQNLHNLPPPGLVTSSYFPFPSSPIACVRFFARVPPSVGRMEHSPHLSHGCAMQVMVSKRPHPPSPPPSH